MFGLPHGGVAGWKDSPRRGAGLGGGSKVIADAVLDENSTSHMIDYLAKK